MKALWYLTGCCGIWQDQSGVLASRLNEAQNEASQLRADLRRVELELKAERSKLHESAAVADRDKVR